MAAAAKLQEFRGPKLGDAASLWNFAPAPGWTDEEVTVLKLCLMKYGVGCWQAIQRSGLLPGKLVQQLVGQAQRLLGQQSLSGFTGLQVDVDRVRADNDARTDVQRKAGLIINMGRTATAEDKDMMRREMQERYGLSPITLREVAAELEERALQRLDQVGGEGLQGVAARAGLHDALGCDASQLPPALAAQLLRRLRIKLCVLVDRLRSHLNLPPVAKRAWEDPEPAEEAQEGDDEPGNSNAQDGPPPAPPIRRPKRGGRGRGRGRSTAAGGSKACGLLKAAQDDTCKGEGATRGKRPGKRRRAGSAAPDESNSDEDDSVTEDGNLNAVEQDAGKRRSHRTSTKAAWEAAMDADIASLQAMGFSRQKAKAALLEVEGGMEEALELLLRQK